MHSSRGEEEEQANQTQTNWIVFQLPVLSAHRGGGRGECREIQVASDQDVEEVPADDSGKNLLFSGLGQHPL